MLNQIPLVLQTAYAELLDRAASAAFSEAFDEGAFTPKRVKGRTYWYFQTTSEAGRKQIYVGPETPELLERIEQHREVRDDRRDRTRLVSTLVRSAHLPRPVPEIGEIVAALADAGVFRLRGVLVGTVAFQTYSGMLGARLPAASVQTEDVDIAQFKEISIAVDDATPPVFDVLQQVDASFREVPSVEDSRRVSAYQASGGVRVEFLTPNQGPESERPEELPSFGTDAQPLRFLDFLIHEPEQAVVLFGLGVHVLVPAPQRYALHKLIVARRRRTGSPKIEKDLAQAEALLEALTEKRPHELVDAWDELSRRGKTWRQLVGEGLGFIDADVRDKVLMAVGASRSAVPNLKLAFAAPAIRYDSRRDVVAFVGEAGGEEVVCAISGEALEDHFGATNWEEEERLRSFQKNRAKIERAVQRKYLEGTVEQIGAVLLKSEDIP